MPNGGQRLGDRLKGWLDDIWERLNLKGWADDRQASTDEWNNIRSLGDLEAWVIKWGRGEPLAIAAKAKELGATDEQARAMVTPMLSGLYTNPSQWLAEQLQFAFASPAWQELNEVFGATVFDPWLASIVGGKIDPNLPEIENIRRFLGTQGTFEAFGSLLSTLVETASAGQIENAGRMFTEAKWLLGTCFTSWQSTSPIVQAVILTPLQRLINRTFRPTEFTRTQWMDLYALGKIDSMRLTRELENLGYDAEKRAWLLSLAKRQLSRSDIFALWHKGIIGPVEVASRLDAMGYSRQAIEELIRLNKKEETSEEKGAYLGTLRKAFKEQLIDESVFREALRRQDRSEDAIDLEVAVLRLDWDVEAKTAAKSDIRSAYMEDTIGRPEAAKWLADAGFTLDTISLLLDTWDKQKAPSYKQLNKAEITKAWGAGILSRPEAYQALIDIGYDERGATVLLETYAKTHVQTKPPADKPLTRSDIMWAWHVETIEKGEAVEKLVAIGFTEEDAEIIFETFQRLHPRTVAKPPKELKKSDILDAWGKGVLTEDEAFERLVAIGYEELDADALMRSYELRPEALPPEPTIQQLIGATRRGVIDIAVLSERLTTMGLKAEDVQFYVSYAQAPLPEKTRSLSKTDIVKLWTGRKHDRAWALSRLLELRYSPEDAEDILWLASPEIEDTETYVLWVAGFIDDGVAMAMWLTMGFTQEQIDTVLGGE